MKLHAEYRQPHVLERHEHAVLGPGRGPQVGGQRRWFDDERMVAADTSGEGSERTSPCHRGVTADVRPCTGVSARTIRPPSASAIT